MMAAWPSLLDEHQIGRTIPVLCSGPAKEGEKIMTWIGFHNKEMHDDYTMRAGAGWI